MIGIQEMVSKTEEQRKLIRQNMGGGIFHPEDASIFTGQKAETTYELRESIRNIPLAEFLAKSGTTGISGGAYLIPDKIHDAVTMYSANADKVPLISKTIVNGWQGGDIKVPIFHQEGYKPTTFSSGGKIAEEDIGGGSTTAQATLSPISFGIAPSIGNDLIEDMQYGIIDYHIRTAAEAMGREATNKALTVLKTATDGVGTVNGGLSGNADETKWTGAVTVDIEDLIAALTDDRWIGNTLVITTEAWKHSVETTYITLASNIPMPYNMPAPALGFDLKIGIPPMDVLFVDLPTLGAGEIAGTALTNCVTIVFDRNNALLTGRKRWMQIENYSNPVEDLAGCAITARQDSVTLYNDAIGVITET